MGSVLLSKMQVEVLQNTDMLLHFAFILLVFPGKCLGKSCYHRRKKKMRVGRGLRLLAVVASCRAIPSVRQKDWISFIPTSQYHPEWPSNHISDSPLWPVSLSDRTEQSSTTGHNSVNSCFAPGPGDIVWSENEDHLWKVRYTSLQTQKNLINKWISI